ncbi:MAG: NADH:ubiquinone reductase (Na(+)-transporting) subunit F [Kiritimatiellia bacterium]|jgi:Na+-transporting NADH:ubiquinone oxidoreductase subunit F
MTNKTNKTATLSMRGGDDLVVPVGDTLFQTLREAHIFIPTVCGGKGFCGECKLKVLDGASAPPTDKERRKLSAEEIDVGWRLSCQIPVQGDMTIELPEKIRGVHLHTATVSALEKVNQDMRRVRLELDAPPTIRFLPGAFVLIDIPPGPGSPRGVVRTYSIATPPSLTTAIELNVRLVPGGVGSGYIHNTLAVGDAVAFTGPYSGYDRCDDANPLLCIGGGSGVAPVLSILRHLDERRSPRKTTFFFGAKTSANLCHLAELRALEKSLPDFTFVPVVEQPAPDEQGRYETGLVTDALARHTTDASACSAYLCGGAGMLNACRDALAKAGMRQENIFFDAFT